jgi:hypothetical protein
MIKVACRWCPTNPMQSMIGQWSLVKYAMNFHICPTKGNQRPAALFKKGKAYDKIHAASIVRKSGVCLYRKTSKTIFF